MAGQLGGLLLRAESNPDLARSGQGQPRLDEGTVKRVFRDSTKAWIESPGPIHWLADGSFLWLSERDGWKHIYHYSADGTLKRQLTSGRWEVRQLEHVDSKNGWVYFTATRDNPVAANLYRVKLADGSIERLTQGDGSHTAAMSPDGSFSSRAGLTFEIRATRGSMPPTAGSSARSTRTRPTRSSGCGSARASESRSPPRTGSCSRPS